MVIGCGGILFYINTRLFLISLIMVLLYTSIVLIYRKPVEYSNRQVMENNAQLQSYFKESIDGLETVKATCAESQVKKKVNSYFDMFINAIVKNSFISITQDTISATIELIGTVIVLWIGFGLVLKGRVSIGSLMTFYALLTYFTGAIKNLIEL